jgi:hypothetical protein
VADLPSRGCSATALAENDEWFHGPKFLKLNEENWPKPPRNTTAENEIALTETTKSVNNSTAHSLSAVEEKHYPCNIGKVIDCHRYNSKTQLLRITAYVIRFIKKQKGFAELSADELNEAEDLWIKDVQNNAFPEEIKQLIIGTKSSSSRVNQLRLFLDDKKIICCEGRIENSSAAIDAKKPILLPAKHHFTDMTIRIEHDAASHTGIKGTLNRIRKTFWILHGRQTVKRVLCKCITCKRLEGKPFTTPKIPHLPSWRTSDEPPFTYTGVDFAGPFNIKNKSIPGQPTTKKSYIALFTCASTRGVHLELSPTLSKEGFLQAFRRF